MVIVVEPAPLGCSGRQGKSGGFRSNCWNRPSSGKVPTRGEGMRRWGLGMDSRFPGPMRERPGGGGLGAGVLSTCHCHPATENTALGQWGRRGREAQDKGPTQHPGSSTRLARPSQAGGLGGWGSTWDAPCHGPDGAPSLGPWRVHLQGTRECSWRFHCGGLGLGHDPQCGHN